MGSCVVIIWEDKKYCAESFEKLLKHILQDEWFGPLSAFAKRIDEIYGVKLNTEDAEAMFRKLHELGELTIVEGD